VDSCGPHHGEEDVVQWSVRVELAGPARGLDPDVVSDVLESLEDNAAVASLGVRSLGVRLSVDEQEALAAQSKALKLVRAAVSRVGLSEWPLVGIGAATMEELAEELARPNYVALAGVSELAKILGVSKQRASELAKSRTFPKPLMVLASGPVWAVPAVDAFSKTWNRRPGPKPVGAKPGAQPVRTVAKVRKTTRGGGSPASMIPT
jgi:hypothetical protein